LVEFTEVLELEDYRRPCWKDCPTLFQGFWNTGII